MFPALVERAVVYPWKRSEAAWEELRFSLRSLERHFTDRDCPIYLLGTHFPEWVREGGRVKYYHVRRYEEALAIGVQLASQVLWMNDDICLLQDAGWDDFGRRYHMSAMDRGRRDQWSINSNGWKRSVARAMDDLEHHGRGNLNCETHVPYLWQREKALEILETYGCWHKMPMETLYVNHHQLDTAPLEGVRTGDPLGEARFLNYANDQVTGEFRQAMEARFPAAPAWELVAEAV